METTLQTVGHMFKLDGQIIDAETIKNGNINITYKVKYRHENGLVKSYIFQRINTFVFKDPVTMMKNIDIVTEHIRAKNHGKPVLHFHHTPEGKNYYFDADGHFWRVLNYIESVTFNTCENLSVVQSTGQAFGEFQMHLASLDASRLRETIPNFHNTKQRLDTLFAHVEADEMHRSASAAEEIAYISSVRECAAKLSVDFAEGRFPVRVTHNDTKSNNVLFDSKTFEPLTVIDLDTVMPGLGMYDFADAVRFIGNTAAEDEPDLSLVHFDAEKFRAFAVGFIGQVKDAWTKAELENLVLATFSITIELAARFLDDYLTGDPYFKILYPEHNLVRTRSQLHLAKDIMRQYDSLQKIVAELA